MDDYREAQRKRWEDNQKKKQDAGAGGGGHAAGSSAVAAPKAPAPSSLVLPTPASSTGTVSCSTSTGGSGSGSGSASSAPRTSPPPAAGSSSNETAPAEPSLSGSTSGEIERVHVLPLGKQNLEKPILECLAPKLRSLRDQKVEVFTGQVLKIEGKDFIVVKADPAKGVLTMDTSYFVEGAPVERFEKIQFLGLKPSEGEEANLSSDALFTQCVGPYFQSQADNEATGGCFTVLSTNETLKIFGLDFVVTATEPAGVAGVVDKNTMIYVDWDSTSEFEKIHVVPFQDTLPRVYEYDLFNDYLKPYLKANPQTKFAVNDQFTFHGVQFKVVCTEPASISGRVGKNTTIYCEGVLHPSLRNLLPPELLAQLSYLPPGLQMLLLNSDAVGDGDVYERLMGVQEQLEARRGMSNATIDRMDKFKWKDRPDRSTTQTQCMVCLEDFTDEQDVRGLPCSHLFHSDCIDEWLRRCTDCPICKTNVDRVIRNY